MLGLAGLLELGTKDSSEPISDPSLYELGKILFLGKPVIMTRPAKAIRYGPTSLPADRKVEGPVLRLSF